MVHLQSVTSDDRFGGARRILAALGSALLPRATMLLLGLFAIQLIGVEGYGVFSLAYATGVALPQFIPDSVSFFFSRLAGKRLGDGNMPPYSHVVNSAGSLAVVAALIGAISMGAAGLVILGLATILQPFAGSEILRRSTWLLAAAGPFYAYSQILNVQLAVNGHEGQALRNSSVLALTQTVLGVGGGLAGGAVGLSAGMLGASIVYAFSSGRSANRLLHLNALQIFDLSKFRMRPDWHEMQGLGRLVLSLALGAPVHWIVLKNLGASENGLHQVGVFSYSFYFYTLIILIPSSLQGYSIGRLSGTQGRLSTLEFRATTISLLKTVVRLASAGGLVFAVLHWFISPVILHTASREELLPGYLSIVAGCVGALAVFLSQLLIASGRFGLQLKATAVSAATYLIASTLTVTMFDGGAASVVACLGAAQVVQLAVVALNLRLSDES